MYDAKNKHSIIALYGTAQFQHITRTHLLYKYIYIFSGKEPVCKEILHPFIKNKEGKGMQ